MTQEGGGTDRICERASVVGKILDGSRSDRIAETIISQPKFCSFTQPSLSERSPSKTSMSRLSASASKGPTEALHRARVPRRQKGGKVNSRKRVSFE